MKKGGYLFFLFLLCWTVVMGQEPVLTSNPGTIRWNQIQTPSFQVIYPRGYDYQAQHIANVLEHIKEEEAETMSESLPNRIPIILNQFQSVSNAFVTMGPWRSEFNMMPSPRPELLGTNQWDELIAAHEYRHIVQFHHSRRGINRLLYYIFGQQAQAGMAFVAVPRWFWEGDATLIETLYTPSGRGRIPAFGRVFRSNLAEGKRFDYNKQHLRSYKDFVPDHYRLGYYFVAHIRRRTRDPEIWEKITADAYAQSLVPFTFSNAMKRHTGIHLVPNYELMMDDLREYWQTEFSEYKFSDPEDVSRRKETTFTDFLYPQQLGDGRIIAMMSGLGDIRQFVAFDETGLPRTLFIPGIINDASMLSARGNKIVYTEFRFDPRWRNRTYSTLKMFNTDTRKVTVLSEKSRFIGADLSHDQSRVVTSERRSDGTNQLVVIDAADGTRLTTFPNPSGGFYIMPRWTPKDEGIIAVRLDDDGKKLIHIRVEDNRESILWDAAHENIGHPVMHDSVVYYNSPLTGIDNIHAFDLRTSQHYQVTNSRYGAYNPEISHDGKTLIFNEHRLNGMDVVRMPLEPLNWSVMDETATGGEYFQPILDQEGGNILDSVPSMTYPVSKYSKAAHMFNIHSWGPLASTDLNSIEVGVASRDVLSTTALSAGYIRDLTENTGNFYAQLSYQDLYPIIDVRFERGNRQSNRGSRGESDELIMDWKETSVFGGIRLPFLLTRSKMISEFTVSNRIGYTRISEFNSTMSIPRLRDSVFYQRLVPLPESDSLALFFVDELADGNLISNNLSFTYYALLKRSPRDINSKYGIVLNGRWLSTPFGGDFSGRTLAARATVYLPSPLQLTGMPAFKHHSLYLSGAWQSADTELKPDLYLFRNQIPRPRGYAYPLYPDFFYAGVNYTMPLLYPDLSLGPVLFLKRLRTNFFFDYGEGTRRAYYFDYRNQDVYVTPELTDIYQSAGVEAMVDLHVMRFQQEIGIGVRYSRLLETNSNSFDLLLNIEF